MSNIVAIIPARAGSKGIPDKNILNLCGKPLLAWSILQAKSASGVDSVWVTSDGKNILDVAEHYGANTVKRPDDISGDAASSESAWLQAVDYIEKKTQQTIDIVIGMQATSPIREARDLESALEIYRQQNLDSLLSVCEIEDFFVWEENESQEFVSVNYDYNNRKPRQKIAKKYRENGSFYLFSPQLLRQQNNRLGGKIGKYEMDFYKMFQIDNRDDVKICEVLMKGYGLDNL